MANIGAQLFTLREYTKTPEQVERTFEQLAADGWHTVQISGMGPIDPKEVRRILDKTGLAVAVTHSDPRRIFGDLDALIDEHRLWGCEYIGIGSMWGDYDRAAAQGYYDWARDMNRIGAKVAAAGLKLVYHNHHFEFARFGERTGFDILMEQFSPDVQFEPDTYWLQAGGADVVGTLKKLVGRMDIVHLKDMVYDPQTGGPIMAEIGQGNLDWPAITEVCEGTGVRYMIVEQDECKGGDPFESLRISLRYLQGLGYR